MSHTLEPQLVDRKLSKQEFDLTVWLLNNSKGASEKYLNQLTLARVESLCGCGCASIDFSIAGKSSDVGAGMEILADYTFNSEKGELNGIFIFAINEQLAGLEVWSIDGQMTPAMLPEINDLKLFEPNESTINT
jgi:hypothetical protein